MHFLRRSVVLNTFRAVPVSHSLFYENIFLVGSNRIVGIVNIFKKERCFDRKKDYNYSDFKYFHTIC